MAKRKKTKGQTTQWPKEKRQKDRHEKNYTNRLSSRNLGYCKNLKHIREYGR
jgi:hypothetical protein